MVFGWLIGCGAGGVEVSLACSESTGGVSTRVVSQLDVEHSSKEVELQLAAGVGCTSLRDASTGSGVVVEAFSIEEEDLLDVRVLLLLCCLRGCGVGTCDLTEEESTLGVGETTPRAASCSKGRISISKEVTTRLYEVYEGR